jgi:cleavage and polyadenylation specificity factor subunit 6/7
MDGDDAGGQLPAAPASPRTEEAIAAAHDDARLPPTPSDGEDYDDLYGDVNVGFNSLPPLSPSPAPTSPPKTPSPGPSFQLPPQWPHRPPPPEPLPAPAPQREPEPQPRQDTKRHQPPQPTPSVPRHHMTPRGGGASNSSSPRCTSLYISELHWWTTDAEVEAALALAPDGAAAALYGLHFYTEKITGMSRGICRADFLHPAAAAAAATALHGHAFHGRKCVASLAPSPSLNLLGDDLDSYAEAAWSRNPTGGLGNGGHGASDATAGRGNVALALADRLPLARPQLSVVPRPTPRSVPFAGIGGYGGFQSMRQYSAGMGIAMMPSALAHRVNPPFLALQGSGFWYDQGISGSFWGAQQERNFGGCQMPWQQLRAPRQQQHQQAQQQFGNWNYGMQGRGLRHERLSNTRSIGNVRYLDRRQANCDGGDRYKENDCEKGRHREGILDKEREQEKHWNQRDRHGGDNQMDRRVRARSRSQSRDDSDDDNPRRRR